MKSQPPPIAVARALALAALLSTPACGDGAEPPPARVADADASSPAPDAGELPGPPPFPPPDAWRPTAGPGAPAVAFPAEALFDNCAYLDGGPGDITDHHNLVMMLDGWLVMPWAPEAGAGGVTLFDVSDPCAPVTVGVGESPEMRETHSIGFATYAAPDGAPGPWAAVDGLSLETDTDGKRLAGVQIWDLSDPTAPEAVSLLTLPGAVYPGAYERVTLATFWQGPYVWVSGADNGVYLVDATDPRAPELVTQVSFEPVMRSGQVTAVGDLLVVGGIEDARTVLLDISDPRDPQPIPGGDFVVDDGYGNPQEPYFSNVAGGIAWYARKDTSGGLVAFDIRDPTAPTFLDMELSLGAGGYVFTKQGKAFVGESSFASIYDISDPTALVWESFELDLEGDLDTVTPIGNIAVLAVDDKAVPDQATAMAPYTMEPDTVPPAMDWSRPGDGATGVALTTIVGLGFDEFIEPVSAFEGSVRVWIDGTDPAVTKVAGRFSVQELFIAFAPREPLAPGTTYVVELPAGGVADLNGNALAETQTVRFTTAGAAPSP